MKENKISVVVFDLGNVLIPFDYNIFLKELDSRQKGLGDEFAKKYKEHPEVHHDFETGKSSKFDFLATMMEWTNYQFGEEDFCFQFSNIFSVNEKVANLLPVLKKNYTLVLLSNTNEIHMEYGWSKYGFLENFDKMILSHQVGAAKPDEKIYKAVEEFTNKPPEEHIFIDDIEEYSNAAKLMGWDSITFTGYDRLVSELLLRKINLDGLQN